MGCRTCRDGELIERGEDEEKYGFSYDGSELTIHRVEKNDEAEYVCIAENKAGEHDATVHLKVFGKWSSQLFALPFCFLSLVKIRVPESET